MLNLAAAAVWDGGSRLSAAIARWLDRPAALRRLSVSVRRRTGVDLPPAVLESWLARPNLVELIAADTQQAVELLARDALDGGVELESAADAFAAVLAAVAGSDEVLGERLHNVNVVRLLEELHAGLGYVFGEMLDEVLAIRMSAGQLADRTARLLILVAEADLRARHLWMALGVDEALASELASDVGVGNDVVPHAGDALVMTAVAGSGKTLTAIRTHQVDLVDLVLDKAAPIPVLIDARAIGPGQLRDAVIARCEGLGDPQLVGVRLVLDGVDEISRVESRRLLFEAAAIASAWPRSSSIAFSRPDVDYYGLRTAPLSLPAPEALEQIAARIVERPHPLTGLPSALREAVKLPFYAIATAVLLRRSVEVPTSRASIIGALVDMSLKDADATDEESLRRLAVSLLETGLVRDADFGSYESAVVARSRLVVRENGTLRFAVPIYQDWFAAQAVMADGVPDSIDASDPWSFDSWRHALSLALALGSARVVDETARAMMATVAAGLPLVLDEATSSPRFETTDEGRALEDSARAREAFTVTYSTFERVLAVSGSGAVDASRIEVLVRGAWSQIEFRNADGQRLRGRGTLLNLREPAWPWRLATEDVISTLDDLVDRRLLAVDDDLAHAENAWALARLVVGDQSLLHRPIDPNVVLESLRDLDAVDRSQPVVIGAPRNLWLGAGMLDPCLDVIRRASERGEQLVRPWVVPDNAGSSTGWVDDLFSPAAAADFLRQLLLESLTLYCKLVEAWFPEFAQYLSTYASLPCLVRYTYSPRRGDGWAATRTSSWHPLADGSESKVVIAILEELPRIDLSRWSEWEDGWAGAGRRRPPFSRTTRFSSGVVEGLFSNRPATHRAYRWLAEDLRDLRWRHRMVPSDVPD